MKKYFFLFVILIYILSVSITKSELKYIDSVDGHSLAFIRPLSISNGNIYFLDREDNFVQISNYKLTYLFANEISKLKGTNELSFIRMKDTSYIAMWYAKSEANYGVIIKDNSEWKNYDTTNAFEQDSQIWDIILDDNSEAAVINITNKITYLKNGNYEIKDCDMDFECMPLPFDPEIGYFYSGCYYYVNSRGNLVKQCDKETKKIFPFTDFQISEGYLTTFQSFQIANNSLYFSSFATNNIYSIKDDSISIFEPLTNEQNIELRFDKSRKLFLKSFEIGYDGNYYLLYKEGQSNGQQLPAPGGRGRVIKMSKDFQILDLIPIPTIDGSPFIVEISKDNSDTSNKKIYIKTSMGIYIYDPDPTSVEISKEDNIDGLFISEVFPNPASDFIEISIPELNNGASPIATVQIFNTLGIEVLSDSIHPMTSSHRMNIESLPSGVYFIKIGARVEKFVKM